MAEHVWRLVCGQNALVIHVPDLEVGEQFSPGRPIGGHWKPPVVEVMGSRSKKLQDLVRWDLKTPVLSERAVTALEALCRGCWELLPLTTIRGTDFFAANVIAIYDCLDHERSEILYSPSDPSHLWKVDRLIFREDRIADLPPIFRIPEDRRYILVSRAFADCVLGHGLTGAVFLDPGREEFGWEWVHDARAAMMNSGLPEQVKLACAAMPGDSAYRKSQKA